MKLCQKESKRQTATHPLVFSLTLSLCLIFSCSSQQSTTSELAPEIWLARAKRDISQSRWLQAKYALEQASSRHSESQLELARVQIVLGETAAAETKLKRLVREAQDPQLKAACHFNLGLLAKKRGETSQALEHLLLAQETQSDHGETWFQLGELYRHTGDYAEGVKAYRKARQLVPTDAHAFLGELLCLVKTGEHEKGRQVLVQATQYLRTHPLILELQIRMWSTGSQSNTSRQKALAFADQLHIFQESPLANHAIAMAYAANNRFAEAATLQAKAGETAQKMGDTETFKRMTEQLEAYQKEQSPTFPFHPDDPRFKATSLDIHRETPYGLVPRWRAPQLSMQDRLASFIASPVGRRSAYRNDIQAQFQARKLAAVQQPGAKQQVRMQYALELLRLGETKLALGEFEQLRMQMGAIQAPVKHLQTLAYYVAIAHLRQAEQTNCLLNHNAQSCIYPIAGEGIHQDPSGAQAAVLELEQILAKEPSNRSARWLLNLAYMFMGQYPEQVPVQYLVNIPQQDSQITTQRFQDVAGSAGLDTSSLAGGSIVEDFDGDGLLDIMASSWGPADPLRVFQNQGNGKFVEKTQGSGLEGIHGGLNLIQTDFDNDGLVDVLVLRGAWLDWAGLQPNSLLRNKGGFTFEDVSETSGLLSFRPTQTAVWFDFDNDGWLDVFIGNETAGKQQHPAELFHNQGNGQFKEIADEVGLAASGFIKGVTAGDMDNDGFVDLYVSRYQQSNLLFKNLGPNSEHRYRFREIASEAGVEKPRHSFPTWFWDFDNDGWLDLFVADYNHTDVGEVAADLQGFPHAGESSKLFRNRGDGTFEDVTQIAGLDRIFVAMGSNFGDIDNDGFLDIYLGTGSPNLSMLVPNRLFRNNGKGRFEDITTPSGMGHLQKGHGVSFADLDHDGDQDVFTVLGGAYSGDVYRNALFENPGSEHGWLVLELVGTQANKPAIGARIEIQATGPHGPLTFYRTVGSGGSFGASPLRQVLGLGDAEIIEQVRVIWPGQLKPQIFASLRMNSAYRLTQGDSQPKPLSLPSFRFSKTRNHQHH